MQAWQQAKISMLAYKMCHIAQQSDSHKVPYLQLCAAIISKQSLGQFIGRDSSLSVVHLILFPPNLNLQFVILHSSYLEPKGNEISIKIRSNHSIHMHLVI